MKSDNSFPWGVYVGDLGVIQGESIPICLDSKEGGLSIIYDEESEVVGSSLIENIALKLLETLNIGDLNVDVFDFSVKKRFTYLASLKDDKIYSIAICSSEARNSFENLEKIAFNRHHNILNAHTPNMSVYNQSAKFKEKYHLLLLNLENFPDDYVSYARFKNFVDSAYDAGFYIISYGSEELYESKNKAIQYILKKFKILKMKNQMIKMTSDIFQYSHLLEKYDFKCLNLNQDMVLSNLLNALKKDEGNEKEFLSVVIGTSIDGRQEVYFTLGDKSKNYHAFITGQTGSGKTTLINNIIMQIAQNYTSDEIRLYLMDYKEGTEFGLFENHPNCEMIYLDNQNINASVELLESFVKLKEQRSQLFAQNKVSDINSYNAKNPTNLMPRNILIIDEVHRLFSNGFSYSEQNHFNGLLEEVAKLGRSFGLHIILTTQSLEGVNIHKSIMNQIPLRISYKLQDWGEASKIFTHDNISEVLKLEKYEFIYNNSGGNKSSNLHARASFMSKEQIIQNIDKINRSREERLILKPKIIDKVFSQTIKEEPIKETFKENLQEKKEDLTIITIKETEKYSSDEEKALMEKIKAWQEANNG